MVAVVHTSANRPNTTSSASQPATGSFVLGAIIFAAVAYREGSEAVLFLLIFLAIWQLATFEPAGHL
jgi:hypothetical protein